MKKVFTRENIKTIILGIIVLTIFFVGLEIVGYYESHYTMKATIVDIESDGVYVAEDATQNLWAFEGEGFNVDDEVKIKFYDAGLTFTREDDEVVDVVLVQSSSNERWWSNDQHIIIK